MANSDFTPQSRPEIPDAISAADLEDALKVAPIGAFALAGAALGLSMLAWLALYFFVFLPRGPVS